MNKSELKALINSIPENASIKLVDNNIQVTYNLLSSEKRNIPEVIIKKQAINKPHLTKELLSILGWNTPSKKGNKLEDFFNELLIQWNPKDPIQTINFKELQHTKLRCALYAETAKSLSDEERVKLIVDLIRENLPYLKWKKSNL